MHIFISGIGGSGMSGIAHLALDLGFLVSGSDLEENTATKKLATRGAKIYNVQTLENIQKVDLNQKIDWFLHTASVSKSHPEFSFATSQQIKTSKRDGFLSFLLKEKGLKLIAIAGTHGKTTTTALLVWAFKELKIPVSYLIGTDLSWSEKAHFDKNSQYFVLEADEFDRNFLHFKPDFSLITSLEYDHPDTYPTKNDYFSAFKQFLNQVQTCSILYNNDFEKIKNDSKNNNKTKIIDLETKINPENQENNDKIIILNKNQNWTKQKNGLQLTGQHNRQNAFLVQNLFLELQKNNPNLKQISPQNFLAALNSFPGTFRRFEKIQQNLYSDYAHHPSEIQATLQLVSELSSKIVVVYEPHQNIRQHQVKEDYKNVFNLAQKVYWLPTFLTREDHELEILNSKELSKFSQHSNLEIADLNESLKQKIEQEIQKENLVVCMGAGSIDSWIRKNFKLTKN